MVARASLYLSSMVIVRYRYSGAAFYSSAGAVAADAAFSSEASVVATAAASDAKSETSSSAAATG